MESSGTDTSATKINEVQCDKSAQPSAAQAVPEKSAPPEQPDPAAPPCPRCGRILTDPEGLGWCPGCGYCRSLEVEAGKTPSAVPQARRQASPLGIVEFYELLAAMPRWLLVLLGGIAIVAVISLAANFMLPEDSLARALWSTIQVGAGLFGLFAAQVWIFVLIAPESDHFGAKDLILSARLWSTTWRRLPATHRQVWLGAWSMAAVLSAAFLIGGFSYWYQPKKLADRSLIAAVAEAAKRQGKKLEESVENFANSQDLTKKKDDAKKDKDTKEDKRPTQDCVIIGYTVENDKQLRRERVTGLVLATLIDGRIKFVGVVQRGIDPKASDELLKRLAPLVDQEPFISGLSVSATWVKPQVFCEVRQSGFNDEGRLRDPNFKDLLNDE